MATIIVLCVLLIQSVAALQSGSPSRQQQRHRKPHAGANKLQNQRDWRPGKYLGLTAGKSRRSDVLRVLGEPNRIDTPADQTPNEPNPEVWYVYDSGGEFAGELTVVIDKRTDVILGINLNPVSLSKEEAVKHFGPDYVITRYDFDECLGNEESAPLYESANGSLLEIEYRQRGIAVSVNFEGKVDTISYVSKPIGTRESRCDPKQEKRIRQKKSTRSHSTDEPQVNIGQYRRTLHLPSRVAQVTHTAYTAKLHKLHCRIFHFQHRRANPRRRQH